jgi:spore photoproduct lyase
VDDPARWIDRLIIDAAAADTRTAQRLSAWARAEGIPVEAGLDAARAAPDQAVPRSKRTLRVVRHQGAVLKPCTGRTESLLCCNLRVVTQTIGCPLDCAYCILQEYQNRSEIVLRADPDEVLAELGREAAARPRRLLRVCTGQVGDSLALEPLAGFAAEAVRFCARSANLVLELKTKTDRVEPLLGLEHAGRTVVSFSLSPAGLAGAEEHLAASTDARLAAAARAAEAGFLIALHLDPIWEGEAPYRELLRSAAARLPAGRLAYLSMGTVRFPPSMRRTILHRFPASRATLGELLPELDGKLRLLRPVRIALYAALAEEARRLFPETFLYLCMEPEAVWRRALGTAFGSRAEVELALAESLHRRFGLAPAPPRAADYPAD